MAGDTAVLAGEMAALVVTVLVAVAVLPLTDVSTSGTSDGESLVGTLHKIILYLKRMYEKQTEYLLLAFL